MPDNLSAQARAQQWAEAEKLKGQAEKESVDAYGSSKFLPLNEYEPLHLYSGSLLSGRSFAQPERKFLCYHDSSDVSMHGDGHIMTFGPNGSGKSVSVVVPNMLVYPGSIVCVDPKGAIAPITARRRIEMGQRIVLLDPFHEVKDPSLDAYRKTFNPLDILDPKSPTLIDDVRLISESLVVGENEKNAFFSDSARTVLECLILFTLTFPPNAITMESIVDLAYRSAAEFKESIIPSMRESSAFGGILAQMANQLDGFTGDAGGSVWMTLRRSLNFLQSPLMQESLKPSDVNFSKLKDEKITVYLVLPATRLDRYGRWLRLMLSMLLSQILDSRKPEYPVLFMIDEAAALRRLEMIESGIALFRGYHIKLWLMWQDLGQLEDIYPDRWSTFIANSGLKQVFNVNDLRTAEYFSQYLGNTTRQVMSSSVQANQMAGGANISHIQRPLMTPDEIMRMRADSELLFYDRMYPIMAQKIYYYSDAAFKNPATRKNDYEPDPYRGGA